LNCVLKAGQVDERCGNTDWENPVNSWTHIDSWKDSLVLDE